MVFLDGAYQTVGAATPVFRPVAAPESSDLQQLVEQIAGRIGRALQRRGLVERDLENAWLARDTEAGPLDDLLGHSITYRIAVGPRAGQKLFTLQMVAPRLQGPEGEPNGAARAGGFSLHAGVDIAPNERAKLERLCRYVSRPPVASEHGIGPGALHAQDAVSGWHHAPCAGAAGSDGAPRGAGADAADALDALSRHVCPAQSVPGGGDAGASGPGCGAAAGIGR